MISQKLGGMLLHSHMPLSLLYSDAVIVIRIKLCSPNFTQMLLL